MELWILGCGSWESVTNAAGLCPPPLSYSSTFTEICTVHNPLSASWYLWTGLWCYCSQPAWPVSAELGLVQKGKGLCPITFNWVLSVFTRSVIGLQSRLTAPVQCGLQFGGSCPQRRNAHGTAPTPAGPAWCSRLRSQTEDGSELHVYG